ncbi:MAG: ribosome biogenesis GTP-binding protein YsxC [Myxococcales bacterium]|nr:ribosome biogenesis GTP-binding protein YsxC [Myxococcales bacterium]
MPAHRIVRAWFEASVARSEELAAGPPEIAFVGRSNVGKSSLLNALCSQATLARVSRTPGRTQRVNVFHAELDDGRALRLVDLPGFGYAKLSHAQRDEMAPMVAAFVENRFSIGWLKAVVLLHDLRRDADDDAIGFAAHIRNVQGKVELVATKADQVPKTRRGAMLDTLQKAYGLRWPPVAVSTHDGTGLDDVRHLVLRACFPQPPKKPRK